MASKESDEGYHGYSNFPTWTVTQWLSGEEVTYRARQGVLPDADNLQEWVEEL